MAIKYSSSSSRIAGNPSGNPAYQLILALALMPEELGFIKDHPSFELTSGGDSFEYILAADTESRYMLWPFSAHVVSGVIVFCSVAVVV
jgi:hypothetical protein